MAHTVRVLFERAAQWSLPVLLVAEFALVRGGWLDWRTAVWVGVGVEGLLVVVGARAMLLAWRGYRAGRRAGGDTWTALEDGLAVLLPRAAARVVALEPRLWVCLALWISGRRPRANEFTYHKGSSLGIFLIVVVFSAPVEILLGSLLAPWAWLRWALLIASLYGLVWVFGLYASLVVLPHRLERDGVRVRQGALAEVFVPYTEITGLEREQRAAPKPREGLMFSRDGRAAYFAIGGKTQLALGVRMPVTPNGMRGPTQPVTIVRLAVDDPAALEAALRARLAEMARGDVSAGVAAV